MREFCESAKRGHICPDDLCHGNPDNTLCGFDKSEWDEMTSEYYEEELGYQDFPVDTNAR